jgi:hypothetical protein
VDFGVVADVDGELGVEIKAFDGGGGGRGQGEFAQFTGEGMGFGRIEHGGFNHDRGELVGRVAETDQGAAGGAGMGAENPLAGFGVKEALGGRDAFDFSAAKPESTVDVEVTAVAEPVGAIVTSMAKIGGDQGAAQTSAVDYARQQLQAQQRTADNTARMIEKLNKLQPASSTTGAIYQ